MDDLLAKKPQAEGYEKVCWLFLRLLGCIYAIAFVSLAGQVKGLIGANGILPATAYLRNLVGSLGGEAYFAAPSVFWWGASDGALLSGCVAGAVLALVLLSGVLRPLWNRVVLAGLFVLYLSFCSVGQDFLGYQWDFLLLETGFLAIFLSPWTPAISLYRWLLFRLMFLSGAVKLLSHDAAWANLSAMRYHYLTQPLPTPLAWYAYQLPGRVQDFSTLMVFVIELGLPFLIFGPRKVRWVAAAGFVTLQLLILATGNYTFFNWLAIALCVFLLDDGVLGWIRVPSFPVQGKWVTAAVGAALVLLSGIELAGVLGGTEVPAGQALVRWAAPFGVVNTYGLFAVMTTERREIVVQGSNDGATWSDYEFEYKPGDVRQGPKWVAPHQPRLDWQMWFAALSTWRNSPWFVNFMAKLLEGSPQVLGLLKKNPFPQTPPKYVRALIYDYQFTNWSTRKASGDWWERRPLGVYLPAVSRESFAPRSPSESK